VIGPSDTVEDVLRLITDRAALLRAFGDAASVNHQEPPDERALSGLADAAGEMQGWARSIHDALDADALGTEIGRRRVR